MSKKEFSPETWMEITEDSVDAFKRLEDELLMYQFKALQNGINLSFAEWFTRQMSQVEKVNEGIIGIIKKHKPNIEKLVKDSFNDATEIALDKLEEVTNERTIVISNSEAVETRLGLVDDTFKLLVANHTRATASLPAKIYSNVNSIPNHTTWTMEEHLKEFNKAIELAYKRELPKMTSVTYSNGREVSFKSYVEMAIRTEVNNVAVDMMQEGCKGLGIVLFLCSSLGDCAPDHKDYQGKVYILKEWKSMIPSDKQDKFENLIKSQNIKTLEWVKEEGTWTSKTGKTYKIALGVRPNCRHTFTPITYEQALNASKTLSELGLKSVDSYDKDKYIQSQKQRAYERKIRELKLDYNNKITAIKSSKNEEEATRLSKEADDLKKSVRNAQEKLREHLKKYPYLNRQYQRENPMRMSTNLGINN